jgi:hypothetical protein
LRRPLYHRPAPYHRCHQYRRQRPDRGCDSVDCRGHANRHGRDVADLGTVIANVAVSVIWIDYDFAPLSLKKTLSR